MARDTSIRILIIITVFYINLISCSEDNDTIEPPQQITNSIVLSSQAELDNFASDYPSELDANLYIGPYDSDGNIPPYYNVSDITDLNELNHLKKVNGSIVIGNNPSLIKINGFDSLEYIGQNFSITENPELVEISGFNQLKVIDANLLVQHNPKLIEMTGFTGLELVRGKIEIYKNGLLKSTNGFNALEVVNRIRIFTNSSLESIVGFNQLKYAEKISINSNGSLKFIEGFSSLEKINGYFEIIDNHRLERIIGFNMLKEVEWLEMNRNFMLLDFSFNSLETNEYCYISHNRELPNIDGLKGLKTVGSILSLHHNDSLTSIEGLKSLEYAPWVEITQNPKLSDFCVLSDFLSTHPEINLKIANNYYSPTRDDIIGGDCKP